MSKQQPLPSLPADVTAARLPKWDLNSLANRPCPVCGTDQHEPICLRPDGLEVVRCSNCGMVFLPNIPSAEQVEAFYNVYSQFKGYAPTRFSWLQCRTHVESNPYLKILDDTGGLHGKSLLEIGCSFGSFLQAARFKGAKVSGVELEQAALSHLNTLGIPAASRMDQIKGLHDIICALQVIEHLDQPAAFARNIAEHLFDDGRLLLSLPNGGESDEAGSTWIGFRIDFEHFNYFSVRTLSRLLAQNHLYVEQVWKHAQPGIRRQRDFETNLRPRIRQRLTSKLLKLWQRPTILPNSSDGRFVLTVLARKVSCDSLS